LYGINSICRSILSQAAGAVLGACKTVVRPANARPRVAISSLGKSCLSYMVTLAPALEARGYEPVVFHALGMGGRAMEALIATGTFVAVFDLALCEVTQHVFSAPTTAGATRLQAAGRRGIPQITGPGGCDMIDMQTWRGVPPHYADRPYHAHNRLVASVQMTPSERRSAAAAIGEKLAVAGGPSVFLLPLKGMEEWDRSGQVLHDPEGIEAFNEALRGAIVAPTELVELTCHINDPLYAETALAIFDRWVDEGRVPRGVTHAPWGVTDVKS